MKRCLLVMVVLLCLNPSISAAAPNAGEKAKPAEKEGQDRMWKRYVKYQKRPYLGVFLLGLTEELRAHFSAPSGAGVLVSRVEKGSPAAKAGLAVGDVLVAVDGGLVSGPWSLARMVRGAKDGQLMRLKVIRKGKAKTLSATLKLRDKPTMEVSRFIFNWPPRGKGASQSPGWDQQAFQDQMEKLQERFQDVRGTENLFKLKHKERQMEQRLKKLEDKIRKLEKKLQSSK